MKNHTNRNLFVYDVNILSMQVNIRLAKLLESMDKDSKISYKWITDNLIEIISKENSEWQKKVACELNSLDRKIKNNKEGEINKIVEEFENVLNKYGILSKLVGLKPFKSGDLSVEIEVKEKISRFIELMNTIIRPPSDKEDKEESG